MQFSTLSLINWNKLCIKIHMRKFYNFCNEVNLLKTKRNAIKFPLMKIFNSQIKNVFWKYIFHFFYDIVY